LSIEQLRERMPLLRQRQQALTAELQAIADQTDDRAAFLRLAETLTAFLARLRSAAETLSVIERQKIVRLLIKDVLVGEDTITIRHSIPIPSSPPQNDGSGSSDDSNYLLCTGREHSALRNSLLPRCLQQQLQEPQNRIIIDSPRHLLQHDMMFHRVKVGPQIKIDDVGLASQDCFRDALDGSVR